MSLIDIVDLSFSYEGGSENIFENVSFQIDTDWKLGFTGRNGRGKTTFLNLLMGKYQYTGKISASVPFDYFPFEVDDKSLNAREVVNEICGGADDWRIKKELSKLDISSGALGRPFELLSNGEKTKTLLAALFLKEISFLLIDEPTNHLDIQSRGLVSRYLRQKKGFILVSHDREFLDGCIDHILSMNRTNIVIQKGNFSTFLQNKRKQDDFENAANEKLKKEIERLSKTAKRTADWSRETEKSKYRTLNSGLKVDRGYLGRKSAKMMKRSKSLENRQQKAIQEKSELLKNVETAESLKISPLVYHSRLLAEFRGISIHYGPATVCNDVGFTVRQGERIALCGKNGSGKSSLLKLLNGEPMDYTGILEIGSGLVVSYLPQDTSFLSGSLKKFARDSGVEESLFLAILRKLDFSRAQFEKDLADYSEGQKKKVALARSLCEKAHLYLWDEPLNYVDVLSRIQIEEILVNYRPTMVFVEHDRAFVRNVATKTFEL